MEMKKEHYEELKEIIKYGLTTKPQMREKYNKHGWTDQMYIWDLFVICVPLKLYETLYNYLNDNQIEPVLLKILKANS